MRLRTPGGLRGAPGAGEAGLRPRLRGRGHAGGGGPGSGDRRPRCGRPGEATRRCCGAWWPPLGPREPAAHDQQALTAGRSGPYGSPRAIRVGESGGGTPAPARSWLSSAEPGHPGSASRRGRPRSRAAGYGARRCGGQTDPGHVAPARRCAPRVDRRRPPLWPGPPRAGGGRGVSDGRERELVHDTAWRGHGRAPRRTGGRGAVRSPLD